ncbi:MAG: dynamin family protein [bacterium]|nr:dynamin family protein [bacterium]
MIAVRMGDSKLFVGLATLARRYGDDVLRGDIDFIIDQSLHDTASVAVIGQFKRGKSTLLNALIGEDILPTGRLPLTGVTTRILHGDRGAVVHFAGGRTERVPLDDLKLYVTEEHNPRNLRGVTHVDVTLPLPMLLHIVFIDTPGIGSTFAHNTQTAYEASERIDLALFITGPEPPITGDEIAFLRQARERADRVIVIVAKIDLVPGSEAEILDFTHHAIKEAVGTALPIYPLDATRPDARIAALREVITASIAEGEGNLARRSLARRALRAAATIRRSIALQRAAALLPASEREQARVRFGEIADEIAERGADLIRAIEQFPTEELVSVDALLETLAQEAETAVSSEIERFVTLDAAVGERALYERIAECETQWSAHVSSALEKRIVRRHSATLRLVTELEQRFAEAGSAALGLRWNPEDEVDRAEFGVREAATRMNGPVPTTGLELFTGGLIATLPGSLRAHVLRKRYTTLIAELLDRSKGRVRSAAVRYLMEWRLANVGFVRERLLSARRIVEDAFDSAAETGDETDLTAALERMNGDERILDAVVAAFP